MRLLDKRLLIQCGKGGVGKTTLTAALALLAAKQGRQTLAVELDSTAALSAMLGASGDATEPREVQPGLWTFNLRPQTVSHDFLRTHLKLRPVYERVAESRIWNYFYDAAPGLKDLLALGKLYKLLHDERPGGLPPFDILLLDAPATGHGLGLLKVARTAAQALVGPLRQKATQIDEFLRDPDRTRLNLVALPEELPVSECLELAEGARQIEMPPGWAFINACEEDPFRSYADFIGRLDGLAPRAEGDTATILALSRRTRMRCDRQAQQRERLTAAWDGPLAVLPRLEAPPSTPLDLEPLVDALEAALGVPKTPARSRAKR